jgi:CRP/FNR family cyclic AMP-dependent transcriptional regulator
MTLQNLPVEKLDPWLVTWGFGGEAFKAVQGYAEIVTVPARTTIFSEGDASDSMYLILEGMAIVLKKDERGVEQTVSIIAEGQSFGEVGLLAGQKRMATVAAGLDVKLLKITPATLEKLEKDRPDLMMQLYKRLAQTFADQWISATARHGLDK